MSLSDLNISRRRFNSLLFSSGVTLIGTSGCSLLPSHLYKGCLSGNTDGYYQDVQKIASYKNRSSDTKSYMSCATWAYEKRFSKEYSRTFQRFGLNNANVIASFKPGKPHDNLCYIVCAHLDSVTRVGGAQGANDNASGSAAVLSLSDLFSDHLGLINHELRFILFAAEEDGAFGSLHYVSTLLSSDKQRSPDQYRIINLDTIAAKRPSGLERNRAFDYYIEYERGSNPQTGVMDDFAAAVSRAANRRDILVDEQDLRTPWVGAYLDPPQPSVRPSSIPSDHLSFSNFKFPALSITQFEDYPSIHLTGDTVDQIDPNRGIAVVDWIAQYLWDELI